MPLRRCMSGLLAVATVLTATACTSPDEEGHGGKAHPSGPGTPSAPAPEKRLKFTWRSEVNPTGQQKAVAATAKAWEEAYWRLAATPDRDEPGITRYGTSDWAKTVNTVLGRGSKPMGGRVEIVLVGIKIDGDRAIAEICSDDREFGVLGPDGRPSLSPDSTVKDENLELVR